MLISHEYGRALRAIVKHVFAPPHIARYLFRTFKCGRTKSLFQVAAARTTKTVLVEARAL